MKKWYFVRDNNDSVEASIDGVIYASKKELIQKANEDMRLFKYLTRCEIYEIQPKKIKTITKKDIKQ